MLINQYNSSGIDLILITLNKWSRLKSKWQQQQSSSYLHVCPATHYHHNILRLSKDISVSLCNKENNDKQTTLTVNRHQKRALIKDVNHPATCILQLKLQAMQPWWELDIELWNDTWIAGSLPCAVVFHTAYTHLCTGSNWAWPWKTYNKKQSKQKKINNLAVFTDPPIEDVSMYAKNSLTFTRRRNFRLSSFSIFFFCTFKAHGLNVLHFFLEPFHVLPPLNLLLDYPTLRSSLCHRSDFHSSPCILEHRREPAGRSPPSLIHEADKMETLGKLGHIWFCPHQPFSLAYYNTMNTCRKSPSPSELLIHFFCMGLYWSRRSFDFSTPHDVCLS